MKLWTKGRVALLEDAGYSASPISGQGNNLALVGAYVFAGELKQAGGNYHRAFNRYNELLHPFVEANQKLGVLVNESILVRDEVSQEVAEEISHKIMREVEIATNMISLPNLASLNPLLNILMPFRTSVDHFVDTNEMIVSIMQAIFSSFFCFSESA